ncbi:MAG: hypothetical protein GOU99_00975 [Candidatus Altiarchaeota archaeon]|nr:hypothetical protein [Candidatus Altiarchaeota archaeon]
MRLEFLGTGGGRYTTFTQLRATGGFRIVSDTTVHIDPGPGAIRNYKEFRFPLNFSFIFISHKHLDHINDIHVLIEAMTQGCKRKHGTVFGPKTAIDFIADYYDDWIEKQTVKTGDKLKLDKMTAEFTSTKHNDSSALGAIFSDARTSVWYSSDTKLIEPHYKLRPDAAIVNTQLPHGYRPEDRMSIDGLIDWAQETKPKLIIMQHFGMNLLKQGPEKEALRVQDKTGIRTIAAKDGQVVELEKEIEKVI